MTDDDDGSLVYYKLTLGAFCSGELISLGLRPVWASAQSHSLRCRHEVLVTVKKAHSEDSDKADHCVDLTSYYVFSTCFSYSRQCAGSTSSNESK